MRTAGTLGAVRAHTLDPAITVRVVQDKIGVPAAVVAEVDHQPCTTIGTLIIVQDADTGADTVITAFPGAPEPARAFSPLDECAGQRLTLGEASALIGHDRYAVMTRLRP